MDLVFLGSGAFGLPTLRHLSERHSIKGIVTQPDRPAGRGKRDTPTPIAAWAAESLLSTPVIKPERVNEPAIVDEVRGWGGDAWVVIAFGQKLGAPLLADRFAINLHASRLPRWRGAAPIHAAVLAGDTETGNSVITLADRMDAGEVLGQSRRAIEPSHTAGELHDLLADDGPALVAQVLEAFQTGRLDRQTQDESLVTLAGKLRKSDGYLDFGDSAEALRRKVHGLTPWPGASAMLGDARLKLLRVEVIEGDGEQADQPGRLVDAAGGVVACGCGHLRLLEVQPAGGRAMPWSSFATGRALSADARLTRIEA
ncbi:MAG: methionyl-tRNA formyltransferase [Planctomycetota bacterium]